MFTSESFLLLPDNSKAKLKELGTTIVQHVISHQWFGDLVTVAWWDYVWMKEGFATYFQYLGTRVVNLNLEISQVISLIKS